MARLSPHPRVLSGLDRLFSPHGVKRLASLKGRRVALLVNPTSVTADLVHAIDICVAHGIDVVRLFGPEHGVRAEAQDMEAVTASHDPISGIEVVSLYGYTFDSLAPTPDQLEDIDVVLCDIQDVGARYYTYIYTIGLMMKVCGTCGVDVWVLDRPNPIGGCILEGNVVDPSCRSFVGMQPIATRHAMTVGELADLFNEEYGWSCNLTVVEMIGWSREMWFDQTGLPWVMPSPNMPTLETATVYPGQCLLEGTMLSEGRGTTRPFELFGHPDLDAVALKNVLTEMPLEGVAFRLASFKPMFQKHAHSICRGLQIHVTDRHDFRSIKVSLSILSASLRLMGESFRWREKAYEFVDDIAAIDLLLGNESVRLALESGEDPRQIVSQMESERETFEALRAEHLRYL